MHSKPVIFISAVSGELKGARQLVANTLTFLGYEPDWQDIFGAEQGDLRGMLRRRIDASDGVVQLVGKCHGFEPHAADGISPLPDATFGRVSYTQYEALYAKKRGKPVWYFFLDEDFPADPHDPEADELRHLQDAYRERVRATADVHHSASTPESLQLRVHELRNELAQLRRSARRQAALMLLLLLLLAAGTAWVLQSQRHSAQIADNTHKELTSLKTEFAKLREGVNALPGVQAQALQQQPGEKLGQAEDRDYEVLAAQLGIEAKRLRVELPALARKLQAASDTAPLERGNAAYVAKDYVQAETFALSAAHAALGAAPPRTVEAIQAYELAGQAAQQRIHYKDALHHLHEAEWLTDRQRDGKEWARVQFALARVLKDDGDYRAAGAILQEVIKEQTAALGPNDPATLLSRLWFGIALMQQDRNREAEQETLAVIELETRYQGWDHPDTLKARNNLGNVLDNQGKFAEAEKEHRAVLALRTRVLGADHADTLWSRNNLAVALGSQDKNTEEEQEYRAVLAGRERLLGPEHPDTLASRSNLAAALDNQGRSREAEQEHRAVLDLRDRVLGKEHPTTLRSRSNLAAALEHQYRYVEAEQEYRASLAILQRVLGSKHPDALQCQSSLANTLLAQGRHAKAETELRAVIAAGERVPERENRGMLRGYYNLALALEGQKKYREALDFATRAEEGRRKVLGTKHADSIKAKAVRERIQAQIEKERAK